MFQSDDRKPQGDAMLTACMNEGLTLRQQLELATKYLTAQQVDEARENAEQLMLYLLQLNRAQLLMNWQEPFPQQAVAAWCQLLERKGQGEPVQYITKAAWFYGRQFHVSPAVLIPRPETELLVEAVLQHAQRHWQGEALNVLDVGTGSGAIAITLQLEQPNWQVIASDLSPDALAQARRNAELHQVASRVQWVQADLLQPFCSDSGSLSYGGNAIDILVSNPPYIPQRDMAGLQREVQQYEPHLALVGGEDGLDPYRTMIAAMEGMTRLPRIIAFELGIYQPAIVAEWLRQLSLWSELHIVTDYGGIDRHIIAIQ